MSVALVEEVVPLDEDTGLPAPLETFLEKEDRATALLRLLRAPLPELLSLVRATVSADTEALTEDQLEELVRSTKMSVAQIDIRTDPPAAIFKQFKYKTETAKYFILVLTDSGPAVLLRDPATKELPTFAELPKQAQKYFLLSERKVAGAFIRRRSKKLATQ